MVEPVLVATVRVEPMKVVESDSVLEYTVHLHHTASSTMNAYRILLEIAVPHSYATLLDASLTPGMGIRVMNGNLTPSGSSR